MGQGLLELQGSTDPVGIARYVELLLIQGTRESFDEAAAILPSADARLRDGLAVQLLTRRRCWHEALEYAQAYRQPRGLDPLVLEGAAVVYTQGGMAARQFRQDSEADMFLGRALTIVDALGLDLRWVTAMGERQRGMTLEGRGTVEELMEVRRRAKTPRQWEHNTHNIAERLGGRGRYREALEILEGLPDARSLGMQAFYRAMLGEAWVDPGGTDDWLKLARAIQVYRGGEYAVGDLHMSSEPQMTYARTLTAAAMLTGGQPQRALGLPKPGTADQRVYRVMVLLGLLERGIRPIVTPEIIPEWRAAFRELSDRGSVLRVAELHAATPMLLLSMLPDAPSELRAWQFDSLILCGGVFRRGGQEWPVPGRTGAVKIAEAAGVPVDPLVGSDPARFREKELRALGESGRSSWVNPGGALRAARLLAEVCPDDPHVQQLPDLICGLMTPDARKLCTGEVK